MKPKIGIIIPCYKVTNKINKVIEQIEEIRNNLKEEYEFLVYIVNDFCPEKSWKQVKKKSFIKFLHHKSNQGVGGAFIKGFNAAQIDDCQVYLKIDSDTQHFPYYLYEIIPYILNLPKYELFLLKGSRYFPPNIPANRPFIRKIGSFFLEPLARVSLGYERLTDIVNGFLAFNSLTGKYLFNENFLPTLNKRYLFESSLIERCSLLACNVHEFLMCARYDNDWSSSLNSWKIIFPMCIFFLGAFLRRLRKLYFDKLNLGTILLILSLLSFFLGLKLFFAKILYYLNYNLPISPSSLSLFISLSLFLSCHYLLSLFMIILKEKKKK